MYNTCLINVISIFTLYTPTRTQKKKDNLIGALVKWDGLGPILQFGDVFVFVLSG